MFSPIALYLTLVILLPLLISALISLRGLPYGRHCPICGTETIRLVSRWLRFLPLAHGERLHSRWCPRCSWQGIARVNERALRMQPPSAVAGVSPATRTIEMCGLNVDGDSWRVLLQAWNETGVWHGQLVFVGPLGRICSDGMAPFSGPSYHAVLQQAMALSEHVLAGRLRSVMSD